MHTGVTGQIRRTAVGRWLLFHINTGLFWIYGSLTFLLIFSLSGFFTQSNGLRLLVSLLLALIAAFTLARLIRVLFWHRFHNVWMDNYVIVAYLPAILLSEYVHDIQRGRGDSLSRLATRTVAAIVAGLLSYMVSRKRTD